MSNKDRPGKSIAFYTDQDTAEKLYEMAEQEHRSVSNLITVLIERAWASRLPLPPFMYEQKVQSNG